MTMKTCGECAHSEPARYKIGSEEVVADDLVVCRCRDSDFRNCTSSPDGKACKEWKARER